MNESTSVYKTTILWKNSVKLNESLTWEDEFPKIAHLPKNVFFQISTKQSIKQNATDNSRVLTSNKCQGDIQTYPTNALNNEDHLNLNDNIQQNVPTPPAAPSLSSPSSSSTAAAAAVIMTTSAPNPSTTPPPASSIAAILMPILPTPPPPPLSPSAAVPMPILSAVPAAPSSLSSSTTTNEFNSQFNTKKPPLPTKKQFPKSLRLTNSPQRCMFHSHEEKIVEIYLNPLKNDHDKFDNKTNTFSTSTTSSATYSSIVSTNLMKNNVDTTTPPPNTTTTITTTTTTTDTTTTTPSSSSQSSSSSSSPNPSASASSPFSSSLLLNDTLVSEINQKLHFPIELFIIYNSSEMWQCRNGEDFMVEDQFLVTVGHDDVLYYSLSQSSCTSSSSPLLFNSQTSVTKVNQILNLPMQMQLISNSVVDIIDDDDDDDDDDHDPLNIIHNIVESSWYCEVSHNYLSPSTLVDAILVNGTFHLECKKNECNKMIENTTISHSQLANQILIKNVDVVCQWRKRIYEKALCKHIVLMTSGIGLMQLTKVDNLTQIGEICHQVEVDYQDFIEAIESEVCKMDFVQATIVPRVDYFNDDYEEDVEDDDDDDEEDKADEERKATFFLTSTIKESLVVILQRQSSMWKEVNELTTFFINFPESIVAFANEEIYQQNLFDFNLIETINRMSELPLRLKM